MPGAPPLAQPTFFTGPNDTLAVQNPYTAGGGVVNAIKDELSNLGISIPDVLKGGKALAGLLPIITGLKNGTLLTNPINLVTRLLASSSQITSAFKLLGPDLQSELTAGLKTLGPVAVTLAGVTQQLKVTNFNNLNSIGNFINSFTNGAANLGIVDKDSIASIIGGIVKQAGGYGITGTFGAVMTGITDLEVINKAAGLSLPSVISNGDIASLSQIASSLSPGGVSLINPSALSQFGSLYSRLGSIGTGNGNAPATDSSTFASVMGAFNSANSAWNTCTRNGSTTTDLTTLTGVSSDFSDMMGNAVMTLPEQSEQQDYALAGLYGAQDVSSSIAENFPNVVQSQGNSSIKNTGTADPQSNGLLDKLASIMPGLSFAKDGQQAIAQQQATDQYYSAMSEINNGTYDPTKYGLPASQSSSNTVAPAVQTSSASTVPTVTDTFGNEVPVTSHILLGYTPLGRAVYSDDGYIPKTPLFSSPP